MIQNPNYKGKWKPPLIDNPDFMVRLLDTMTTRAHVYDVIIYIAYVSTHTHTHTHTLTHSLTHSHNTCSYAGNLEAQENFKSCLF